MKTTNYLLPSSLFGPSSCAAPLSLSGFEVAVGFCVALATADLMLGEGSKMWVEGFTNIVCEVAIVRIGSATLVEFCGLLWTEDELVFGEWVWSTCINVVANIFGLLLVIIVCFGAVGLGEFCCCAL